MFNLGFSELIVLGAIALIFIGPKQLPEVAKTLGRLINEWKRATSDLTSSFKDNDAFREWEDRKQKYFAEMEPTEKTEKKEESPQLEMNLDQENPKDESGG